MRHAFSPSFTQLNFVIDEIRFTESKNQVASYLAHFSLRILCEELRIFMLKFDTLILNFRTKKAIWMSLGRKVC